VDLVIVSPHLDDAVLSLGATIARTVEEGGRVLVVSCFTGAPEGPVPEPLRVFADYEARTREDASALSRLGADHRWLGLVERAFRVPMLGSWAAVFETPAERSAFPHLSTLRDVLVGLAREHPRAELCLPLGVGNHVDHVEVFLAGLDARLELGPERACSFYEDPYALGTRMRARHFVTRERRWARLRGPDLTSLRMLAMMWTIARARRGPPVEALAGAPARALSWRVEPRPVADRHRTAQLEALACYPSQVRALGGIGAWRAALRRWHEVWGGGEPRWTAG
jgi:LmbE family N-acetylglucosaminyl deacetylase